MSLLRGPLPLLLPGIAISLVVAVLVCRRVGRALGIHALIAFVLVFSLGVIIASTLTPVRSPLLDDLASRSCDLSRIGPAPLAEYFSRSSGGDAMGNVLLFIPLGWAVASIPRSRRKALLLGGAIALPFAIETLQLLVTAPGRGCESADVFDNLLGLAIGLAAGALTAWLLPSVVSRGGSGAEPGPP